MKKKTIETIITSVLVIILFFAISNIFKSKHVKAKKKAVKNKVTIMEKRQPEMMILAKKEPLEKLEKRAENSEWLRDPFTYTGWGVTSPIENFKLEGIVWDRENAKAIINDTIAGTGDKIGDITIVEIKQDRVILNDGNNNFELRLGQ